MEGMESCSLQSHPQPTEMISKGMALSWAHLGCSIVHVAKWNVKRNNKIGRLQQFMFHHFRIIKLCSNWYFNTIIYVRLFIFNLNEIKLRKIINVSFFLILNNPQRNVILSNWLVIPSQVSANGVAIDRYHKPVITYSHPRSKARSIRNNDERLQFWRNIFRLTFDNF